MAKSFVDPEWELLFSPEVIAARVAELGKEITAALAGKEVLALPVMTGGIFFAADLLRTIDLELQISTVTAKSYVGTASTGALNVLQRSRIAPAGRTVLVIDDVLDSGITAQKGRDALLAAGAKEVFVCVLFEKPLSARAPGGLPHADFVAFEAPPRFLIGYGMDLDERYRALPGVYARK